MSRVSASGAFSTLNYGQTRTIVDCGADKKAIGGGVVYQQVRDSGEFLPFGLGWGRLDLSQAVLGGDVLHRRRHSHWLRHLRLIGRQHADS